MPIYGHVVGNPGLALIYHVPHKRHINYAILECLTDQFAKCACNTTELNSINGRKPMLDAMYQWLFGVDVTATIPVDSHMHAKCEKLNRKKEKEKEMKQRRENKICAGIS